MPVTKRNITRQFPFGEDVDTLIICCSPIHRDTVVKAFQVKAMYDLPFSSMTGRRFKRIIVFSRPFISHTEAQAFARWVNESLRLKLEPGGELHIV
jgi:hypothetical protein